MIGKRRSCAIAGAILPLALAIQTVLALGDVPPIDATPEPAQEPRRSIDPGFAVVVGGDVDPGFVVVFEDRSHDTGFLAPAVGAPTPAPSPTPSSAPPTSPAIVLRGP